MSCNDFEVTNDPETQLSLLVLNEAKYLGNHVDLRKYRKDFFQKFKGKIMFLDSLKFISESSDSEHSKLLIILNSDETNFQ